MLARHPTSGWVARGVLGVALVVAAAGCSTHHGAPASVTSNDASAEARSAEISACVGEVSQTLRDLFDQPNNDAALLNQLMNTYGQQSPQYQAVLAALRDATFTQNRVAHGITSALAVELPQITVLCAGTNTTTPTAEPLTMPATNSASSTATTTGSDSCVTAVVAASTQVLNGLQAGEPLAQAIHYAQQQMTSATAQAALANAWTSILKGIPPADGEAIYAVAGQACGVAAPASASADPPLAFSGDQLPACEQSLMEASTSVTALLGAGRTLNQALVEASATMPAEYRAVLTAMWSTIPAGSHTDQTTLANAAVHACSTARSW